MSNFSQEINNFIQNGSFLYKFDSVGNVLFNFSSSIFQQNFLSLDIFNYDYNSGKILQFYNPSFTEFQTGSLNSESSSISADDLIDKISLVTQQNNQLQNQLNQLVALNEINSNQATILEIKDIILGLRISLKQGSSSLDFSSKFPYLPLPSN